MCKVITRGSICSPAELADFTDFDRGFEQLTPIWKSKLSIPTQPTQLSWWLLVIGISVKVWAEPNHSPIQNSTLSIQNSFNLSPSTLVGLSSLLLSMVNSRYHLPLMPLIPEFAVIYTLPGSQIEPSIGDRYGHRMVG